MRLPRLRAHAGNGTGEKAGEIAAYVQAVIAQGLNPLHCIAHARPATHF